MIPVPTSIPEDTVPDAIIPGLENALDALVSEDTAAPQERPLLQALRQFLEIARSPQAEELQPGEITELGDYALQVLHRLAVEKTDVERWGPAALAVADWVIQRGGRLQTLEPVVDALAHRANRLRDPAVLGKIADFMGEVIGACAQSVRADLEAANPGRPWRLLHLNRAITATRSLDPERMERAFEALTAALPQDAAAFFQEGMREMDRLDYPAHVREVVARYHGRWRHPRPH